MIILCVVMFKSIISILYIKKKHHFALLNHKFFQAEAEWFKQYVQCSGIHS